MEIPIKHSLLFFMENEIQLLGFLMWQPTRSSIVFVFSLFYANVQAGENVWSSGSASETD